MIHKKIKWDPTPSLISPFTPWGVINKYKGTYKVTSLGNGNFSNPRLVIGFFSYLTKPKRGSFFHLLRNTGYGDGATEGYFPLGFPPGCLRGVWRGRVWRCCELSG
jgi:hypothetical protein